LTNLQEYVSGTDPRDAASYLKINSILADSREAFASTRLPEKPTRFNIAKRLTTVSGKSSLMWRVKALQVK